MPADMSAKGKRLDGVKLMDVWKTNQEAKNRKALTVKTTAEFKAAKFDDYDYILGGSFESSF